MSKLIEITDESKLTIKQRKWFDSYLKCFNNTRAAIDAGYKNEKHNTVEVIGYQNFRKLRPLIAKWLDEVGLSDEAIKAKIRQGMEAKETKFFADKGIVTDQREVEALGIQAKYADMAAKVRGSYSTGPGESADKPLHIKVLDRFSPDKDTKADPSEPSGSTKEE